MKFIVTSREERWAGKGYARGSVIEVEGEREIKQARLLETLGRVRRPAGEPVGQVTSTRALAAAEPATIEAPAEAATAPTARSRGRRYPTRSLKAET